MIQEYLNAQFIQTAEDANFDKLKKVCNELGKRISKDRSKILALSLVAFDPEIPPDNKEVIDVQNQIIEAWQTFVPNAKDTALTAIRAVMLEALKTAAEGDSSNTALIWFATRNICKHYKLGREANILTEFLIGLGNNVEAEAEEGWNFSPDYAIEVPKTSAASVDEADMATFNPAGVKEAVGKALKRQTAELRASQKEFGNQVAFMQMRTLLLWWKEARYSSSKKSSYTGTKKGELEVLLAYDYSDMMPHVFPASVDYFLRETLKELSSESETNVKLSDFLKNIDSNKSVLKKILKDAYAPNDRISLMDFISGLVHDKYQIGQLKSLVGVEDKIELTPGQITAWLFHDFQAFRISLSKL